MLVPMLAVVMMVILTVMNMALADSLVHDAD